MVLYTVVTRAIIIKIGVSFNENRECGFKNSKNKKSSGN